MGRTITSASAENAGRNKHRPAREVGFTNPLVEGLTSNQAEAAQPSAPADNTGGSGNAVPAEALPAVSPLPSFGEGRLNLEQFRLGQNFETLAPVAKLITVIPVRKPSKEAFVRTYADEDRWFPAALIELKETSESYLVARELWGELQGEPTFVSKLLIPTIGRRGELILWPIRFPGTDGRLDDWNASALEAARLAKTVWVRLASNRTLGAYDTFRASSNYSEPVWPELTVEKMITIAFRDRMISSLDHGVIKGLRGEQ